MTAEIAIISRSAVTLAADSAMTMSVRGVEKIYPSADKLFELSIEDAIGAAIYNNLEFMGAPLDVIIKQFRSSQYCTRFQSLLDTPASFFKYLVKEWLPSTEEQDKHVKSILLPTLIMIQEDYNTASFDAMLSNSKGKPDLHRLFVEILNKYITMYNALRVAECFTDVSENYIADYHADAINQIIHAVFERFPLDEDDRSLVRRVCALLLHRDIYSDLFTGIVFAGFGQDEMFPSLQAFEIDGIVAGRLKKKVTHEVTANQGHMTSEIIPFAQRDIIDRYLEGMDKDFEREIQDYFKEVLTTIEQNLLDGAPRVPKRVRQLAQAQIADLGKIALEHMENAFIPKLRQKFRQQMEDMVLFMPKQDLANLAEALVNITSLKRRFSGDQETVAGPIDVAVISKSDGFVWVRRKHYFDANLNPRFFVRKFGMIKP